MTTPKTMLCRCEDLTLDECRQAIDDGYACFEDLKRFLGVGTGPCQGKSCVQAAMHLVAEARGIPVSQVDVMTFRPPVRPVSFATLAAPDAQPPGPPGPARAVTGPSAPSPAKGTGPPSGSSGSPGTIGRPDVAEDGP